VFAAWLLSITLSYAKPDEYECVRWAWTGDVYNRKVICLEWRKKRR
jgi:hypothetical protein